MAATASAVRIGVPLEKIAAAISELGYTFTTPGLVLEGWDDGRLFIAIGSNPQTVGFLDAAHDWALTKVDGEPAEPKGERIYR